MFGHPPIIILLVVADRNALRATANSELVLLRTPPDTCGSSIDPQQHKGVLPLTIGPLDPDIGVSVTGASDNAVGVWGPVNSYYQNVRWNFPEWKN